MKVKSLLLAVLLVLNFFSLSIAATYYIDATNGKNDNSGTTQNAPWQTLEHALSQLTGDQSGNQLLLKCGEIWREALVVQGYGTSGSPFTIGAYGVGAKPVILPSKLCAAGSAWTGPDGNGEYYRVAGAASEFAYKSTNVIRGQSTGVSTYKWMTWGTKGSLTEDAWDYYVNGSNMEVWYKPLAGHTPNEYDFDFATKASPVYIYKKNYVTIDGLTILHGLDRSWEIGGVNIRESDYAIVKNCDIYASHQHGIVIWDSDYGQYLNNKITGNRSCGIWTSNYSTHLLIQGNTITNNSKGLGAREVTHDRGGIMLNVNSSYIEVYDNVTDNNGNSDPTRLNSDIFLDGTDYVNVERNYVRNAWRRGIGMSVTAPNSHHVIRSNIINRWNLGGFGYPYHCAIMIQGIGTTDQYIVCENNSCYSDDNMVLYGIHLGATSDKHLRSSSIRNNIVYLKGNTQSNSRGLRCGTNYYSDTTINNNAIYGCTNLYELAGYTYTSAAAFYASTGFGQHDLNSAPLFIDPDNGDFRLSYNSPCKTAGASLGRFYDFMGNNFRETNRSMGAIQYLMFGGVISPRKIGGSHYANDW